MVKARTWFCLALLVLFACAPQATIADADPAIFRFVELPRGDLAAVGNGPISSGQVQVIGLELVIDSPYCQLKGCLPNEDGYIRLTYPRKERGNYPNRLEIQVVSGISIKGRALFALAGEDVSREALLKTQ